MTLSSVIQKRTVFGKDGQFTGVVNAVGTKIKSTGTYVQNEINSNDNVVFLLAANAASSRCEVRSQTDHPISFLVNGQEKVVINKGFTNDVAAELQILGSNGFIGIHNALTNSSYNPIVSAGTKAIIFSDGSPDTGSFAIAPQQTGSNVSGIKIDGTTGNVGISTKDPQRRLHVTGSVAMRFLPIHANNAAAVAGGLAVYDLYQTSTGELRIVV
jgi:hypothetical protein